MRLINLIGLFLLLLSFAVEGQNLAIRQPGKELHAILFGVWYLECFPVYPGAVILSHSGNCGIRLEWIKQPCMAIGMKTTLLKRTMQISLQPFIRMKIKLFS